MPRIPARLKNDPFSPSAEWPEDCLVQWGGSGIVLSPEKPFRTAFFEAFPADGSAGFIRAEADTVDKAERKVLASWRKKKACYDNGGHQWARGRRLLGFENRKRKGMLIPRLETYTNGGCFCLKCNSFQTAMKPIHRLGAWRDPITYPQLDFIMSGLLKPDPEGGPGPDRMARKAALKAKIAGIDLPDWRAAEFQPPGDGEADPWEDSPYEIACQHAVADWYRTKRAGMETPGIDSMSGLFDSLTRSRLDRLVKDIEERENDVPENIDTGPSP